MTIQDEKTRAEINKLVAETRSLAEDHSWFKKWTPLILSLLALFGGYTQYTKLSIEDREASVEAREEILKSEKYLKEQELILMDRNEQLSHAEEKLKISEQELAVNLSELKRSEQELENKKNTITATEKELEDKTLALNLIIAKTKQQETKLEAARLKIEDNNKVLAIAATKGGASAKEVEDLVNSSNAAIESSIWPTWNQLPNDLSQETGLIGFFKDEDLVEVSPGVAKWLEKIIQDSNTAEIQLLTK